jgi:hypothetical protein
VLEASHFWVDLPVLEVTMDDPLIQLTDSFRKQRESLQRQLDMLESGKFSTGDQLPTGNVDTTEDTKRRVREAIDELDQLISKYGSNSG